MFERLSVTCAGCHTSDQRPFFASLAAFENLIVYDPRWIEPGSPERSPFITLLHTRMPPRPQDPFATQSERGETEITMPEIEQWITNLPPRDPPPANTGRAVRRKSAELVRSTLMQQLNLTDADFYDSNYEPLEDDVYAVRSPDAMPFASSFDQGGVLFGAMGGPDLLSGEWRDDEPTASFAQAIVPVSQAWCRIAFSKSDNGAVYIAVSSDDMTEIPVKQNIAALHLKMLGEPATDDDVNDLYSVFTHYPDAVTAWTAVCSALVRDPLWVLY